MTGGNATVEIAPVLPRGPGLQFALLGDAGYKPASGGTTGGWQIVDRPRLVAATQWFDRAPWELDLPLLLDGGQGLTPRSVERDCALLESWTEPSPGQQQPPVLQVSGLSVPGTHRPWVLNVVEFQGAIRDAISGRRTQQAVQLTLWEYSSTTSGSPLSPLTPAQLAQQALGASTASNIPSRRTYIVRQRDTLTSIAAVQMGDSTLWPLIAQANAIRDPRNIRVGQELVIP